MDGTKIFRGPATLNSGEVVFHRGWSRVIECHLRFEFRSDAQALACVDERLLGGAGLLQPALLFNPNAGHS